MVQEMESGFNICKAVPKVGPEGDGSQVRLMWRKPRRWAWIGLGYKIQG
jgi:hypothetical protein